MSKRTIKAKDIINDIKSGKIYVHLLDKYKITPIEFRGVFRQLLNAQVVEPYQLLSGRQLDEWMDRYEQGIYLLKVYNNP